MNQNQEQNRTEQRRKGEKETTRKKCDVTASPFPPSFSSQCSGCCGPPGLHGSLSPAAVSRPSGDPSPLPRLLLLLLCSPSTRGLALTVCACQPLWFTQERGNLPISRLICHRIIQELSSLSNLLITPQLGGGRGSCRCFSQRTFRTLFHRTTSGTLAGTLPTW